MKFRFYFIYFLIVLLAGCSTQKVDTPKLKIVQEKKQVVKKKKPKTLELKQNKVDEELISFIKELIKAFVNYDLTKINNTFINKEFGFYDLYKIDGNISFKHQKEILNLVEEEVDELNHIISRVEKDSINYALIEQNLDFNCSFDDDAYYGWNGEGLYLSKKTDPILLNLMTKTNEYEKNKYSKKELQKVEFIQKTAYKVILTPELIFYVNKIDGNWYITLFDRITTDCSSN